MSINLNNFVQIDIKNKEPNSNTSTRDTVVFYTTKSSITNEKLEQLDKLNKPFSSLIEVKNALGTQTQDDILYKYAKIFFENGGIKLQVIKLTKNLTIDDIDNLQDEQIVITADCDLTTLHGVAKSFTPTNNCKQKIFIGNVTKTNTKSVTTVIKESIEKPLENFVLKVGSQGIEMTIAAYLSKVDINKANSIQDYSFTEEILKNTKTETGEPIDTYILDDNMANELIEHNNSEENNVKVNFDTTLINKTRNIGGDDTEGNDIINQYVLIILQQTLTERLITLLSAKLKYNQTSLNLISATISNEMQRYVANGYLTTDKIYEDEDLIYEGYTLITNGSPLNMGYKFLILPFSTLKLAERKKHMLPKIYIIIATGYSIRKIEISGFAY